MNAANEITVVSVGPWPWSHFYNRAQPLAVALAHRGCRVVYIDPVEGRVPRLRPSRRLWELFLPLNRARAKTTQALPSGVRVAEIVSRRGRQEKPFSADYSPAARLALQRFLVRETRGSGRRHLVISRHPKLSVTQMLPWDHVTFDIEDPWFDHPWGRHPFVQISVRQALARADLVTANGHATEEMFREIAPRPITVMPNGVERTLLDALDRAVEPPDAFNRERHRHRLLFTGRIDARIHFDLLAEVLPEFPDLDVYFVGEAHIWPEIRQPWDRLMACDHFFHVPRVPYEEMPRFLAHADGLLLPYSGWGSSRMFPGKLLEYIAAAKPVFASRHYREVEEVAAAIKVYSTADELRAVLRRERDRGFKLDPALEASCGKFVRDNTWERRAETLLQLWGAG